MARLSTGNLVIGAARTLGAGLWRITPLTTRAWIAGLMRIPLKVRIPVVIVFAGLVLLVGLSQGRGGSSAMHAACSSFRQWESSHNTATLASATNNLDRWVQAQNDGVHSNQVQRKALALDSDIGDLDLVVQHHLPGSLPADTRNVVNDCRGI